MKAELSLKLRELVLQVPTWKVQTYETRTFNKQFHYEKRTALPVFTNIVDGANVRVIDARGCPRFSPE